MGGPLRACRPGSYALTLTLLARHKEQADGFFIASTCCPLPATPTVDSKAPRAMAVLRGGCDERFSLPGILRSEDRTLFGTQARPSLLVGRARPARR